MANKGVWIPDRSKATERDPPLYLHISASSKEQLDKAVAKVNELIAMDLGSLTEDKTNQQRTRVRISYHLVFYSLTNLLSSENGRKKS